MCGAAAESILFALAVEKTGDEERIGKDLASAGGRVRVENLILGPQPARLQRSFGTCTELLKYWRDAAAHGQATGITEDDADTALMRLLRLAQLADDNWDELTKNP